MFSTDRISLLIGVAAIVVTLGKVDQRLLTIERVVLPPASPGEDDVIHETYSAEILDGL